MPEYGRHKAIKRGCNLAAPMRSGPCASIKAPSRKLPGARVPSESNYSRVFFPPSFSPPSSLFHSTSRVRVSFLISYARVHLARGGKKLIRERVDGRPGGAYYWLRENDGSRIIMIGRKTPGVTCVIVNYQFPCSLGTNNLFQRAEITLRKNNNSFRQIETDRERERERERDGEGERRGEK